MKKDIQISNELNDIIAQLKQLFFINFITEADDVSTINTQSVTIFNNLDKTMVLKDGMIITINDINYPVSNVVNLPNTKSFDITAVGLISTTWNVAANFQPGTRKEVNEILQQKAGDFDRFPLIWLIMPNEAPDKNSRILDFTVNLVLVFANRANDTDRTQKRIDENFTPKIQPLLSLFLLWLQSSDFNYMLEFFGHGKPIEYNPANFAFYGKGNKKVFTSVSTDAIEVSIKLNFKKQFDDFAIPGTPIFPTDAIHEYLFLKNTLDTGSVGNDITINEGVIDDIMTTDRHGNANSAMRSSNAAITLRVSDINLQKGWSLNWWQLMDAGSANADLFYYGVFARWIRFVRSTANWDMRPNAGSQVTVNCNDFAIALWQNFHVNYGNGAIEVFLNNVSQGTASNEDHTTPLIIQRLCSGIPFSVTDVSFDDIRIFERLLNSNERQGILLKK